MSLVNNDLPPNWIRKESKSRSNQFYFFNVKTGETQWRKPENNTNNDKKTKETDEKSRFKIGSKSKKEKKSKAPAQDRLQNLIRKNKVIAESLRDTVNQSELHKKQSNQLSNNNNKRDGTTFSPLKNDNKRQRCSVTKKMNHNKSGPTSTIVSHLLIQNRNDEIPNIFPSKTPAQDRLKNIQQNLTQTPSSVNRKSVNKKISNDALQVIKNSFGIEFPMDRINTSNANTSNANTSHQNDNMEMDWEPSVDNETNDTHMPWEDIEFTDLNEAAYIVLDTNVMIDSLLCIENIIEKDEKYCVLVPFVVLQELDRLKNRSDEVSIFASSAIKFIYKQLKSENQRLQGQKATDDKQHIIDIKNNDDKILNCCLQLKNQLREVILLTNDVNLSNKALINNIEAITSKECLKKYNNW